MKNKKLKIFLLQSLLILLALVLSILFTSYIYYLDNFYFIVLSLFASFVYIPIIIIYIVRIARGKSILALQKAIRITSVAWIAICILFIGYTFYDIAFNYYINDTPFFQKIYLLTNTYLLRITFWKLLLLDIWVYLITILLLLGTIKLSKATLSISNDNISEI